MRNFPCVKNAMEEFERQCQEKYPQMGWTQHNVLYQGEAACFIGRLALGAGIITPESPSYDTTTPTVRWALTQELLRVCPDTELNEIYRMLYDAIGKNDRLVLAESRTAPMQAVIEYLEEEYGEPGE